jgi:hypothetical protein
MKKSIVISLLNLLLFTPAAYSQAIISGRVYNDISNNNLYNPGEELSNVTVWLLDLNAVAPYYRVSPVATAITDGAGVYSFTNVAGGDYQVRVMQSTIPATITRALSDNDSYPNGLTNVMGVNGSNTYANIDFVFGVTATAPAFTSERNFQWDRTNTFVNTTSKTYTLPQETINGNTIFPTITWTTDRTSAPGGEYGTDTYPQASYSSAVLGQGYPGNNKGGIHPADNTFQLIFGGAGYTSVNNDLQKTTIEFNVPVINTKFSIYDIDHADPQRATGRIDHVKVTGYKKNVPVIPIIVSPSAAPWNTVSGNTVYGFADYPLTNYTLPYNSQNEDHGTVNVYFPNLIDKIVIDYEEWAPVMLIGKGILDATPPNLATDESIWVERSGANAPTYRGISIGSIDYTVDAAIIVLPVRLKEFKATSNNCFVLLNWESEYEENLDTYEIEYSKDGLYFLPLGQINAINNSSGSNYSFNVPQHVTSGFYRLKIQDKDGTFNYSDVKSINVSCNNKINWFILGNPAGPGTESIIKLFVKDETLNHGTICIWDMSGKKLLEQAVSLQPGQRNISLKTGHLKSGLYIVGLYDNKNIPAGEFQKLNIQ